MNENKIYCGNGKEKFFNNGGSVVNLMVDLTTLEKYFTEYGFTSNAGNKKIKLKVFKNMNIDNYGNTHNVQIDTFKPNKSPVQGQESSNQGNFNQGFKDDEIGSNIPF